MRLNEPFTVAHIVMALFYAALLICYSINEGEFSGRKVLIAVTVVNGVIDIAIPCLICNIIY
jgi:hypothetical protein